MSSADQFAGAPGSSYADGSRATVNPVDVPAGNEPVPKHVDNARRNLLIASCTAGGIAGVAALTPFVGSMEPSERARAAGAPVEADITGMATGELRTFAWRGKPVWVVRRSPEMIAALPKHDNELADPKSLRSPSDFTPMVDTRNEWRSLKPEYLVAVGVCTHLGCSPTARFEPGPQANLPDDWPGGWLCPCHGSTFDMAGRVFKNKPAPDNLAIPPYSYVSDSKILIGEEKKKA